MIKCELDDTLSCDSYDECNMNAHLASELCAVCKSPHLHQSGTCKACIDCGTTTGCS